MNLQNTIEGKSNETKATVRTTANLTSLTLVVLILNRIFDWDISLDDLLPFTPLIAGVIAAYYRISRYVAKRWPTMGYLLFAYVEEPRY